MAQKQFCVKSIELSQHFSTTVDLFFAAERAMSHWLESTSAGKWCEKNLLDLTFRINYCYNNKYPVVNVLGMLTSEEYTWYLLIHSNNEQTLNGD